MSSSNKMENKTVRELREIAKQRGVRGYYSVPKAQLVKAIFSQSAPQVLEGFDAWADEQLSKKVYDNTKSAINTFADWILNHTPETVKQVVNAGVQGVYGKTPRRKTLIS